MENIESRPKEIAPEDIQFQELSQEGMKNLFDPKEEIGLGEYQIFSAERRNTNGLETCAAIVAKSSSGEWLLGHVAGPDLDVENTTYPQIIDWLKKNPGARIYIFGVAPSTEAAQSLRIAYTEQLSNLGSLEPHFNEEPKPISLSVDAKANQILISPSIKGTKVEIEEE